MGNRVDAGTASRPRPRGHVARGPHWLLRTALYMTLLRTADASAQVDHVAADLIGMRFRLNRLSHTPAPQPDPGRHPAPDDVQASASTPRPGTQAVLDATLDATVPVESYMARTPAPPAPPLAAGDVPGSYRYGDVCRDADWRSLAANERAGRGLACAMASTDGGLHVAIQQIRASREWGIAAWRQETDAVARGSAWRTAGNQTRETLRALSGLAMFVAEAPDASRARIVARARALLADGGAAFDDAEAFFARHLWLDVDDWLDIDALHRRGFSPVDLLDYACRWCGLTPVDTRHPPPLPLPLPPLASHPPPPHLQPQPQPQPQPPSGPLDAFDRCGVELAAVLDARLVADASTLASLHGFTPLVSAFESDFHRDLCRRWYGMALLPASVVPPAALSVWFDGATLLGAAGMSVAQLTAHMAQHRDELARVLDAAHAAAPVYCRAPANVTLGTLQEVIVDRLDVIAESTDYPFGTPHQSLATVLLRLGPSHGVNPSRIDEPDCLFERYAALEAAWAAAPRYPVAPHLAAAFHLARSSGLLIRDARPVDTQLIDIVRGKYASLVDASHARDAITAWLEAQGLTLWRDLPTIAGADLSTAPAPLRATVREYQRLKALPQELVVPSGEAGARALADYLESRLLAYGAVPECRAEDAPQSAACMASPLERDAVLRAIDVAREKETARLRRADTRTHSRRVARSPAMTVPRHPSVAGASPARGIHDLRGLLNRVLIVSTMIDQTQRPGATALDFIPFVGSAYTLGAGLRERDARQALRGAFGFSLDALFVWISGATERLVGRQVARLAGEAGLAPHEPYALAMLADVGPHLDVVHPGALPAGNVIVEPEPSGVVHRAVLRGASSSTDGTSLQSMPTEGVRDAHERASLRSWGAPALTWEDALTSRHASLSGADDTLSRENGDTAGARTPFPALQTFRGSRSRAPTLRKRFRSASADRTRSLAAPRDGAARRSQTLRGALSRGRPGDAGAAAPSDVFLSRSTVAKAQEFIETRDFIVRIGAEKNGDPLPRVDDFLRLANSVDSPDDAAAGDFAKVCHTLQALCARSPTLRALLRVALNARKDPAARFSLRFLNGTPPRCDLQHNLIVLSPVDMPLDAYYVDAQGLTPFQRERAWLHELVHALTGIEDVADRERIGHRGAVVYFTDRILFEAGPELPERVMYQHAKLVFASGRLRTPDPAIDAGRRDAAVAMLAEDAFLDDLLRNRMRWAGTETLLGMPVEQRATFKQMQAFRWLMAEEGGRPEAQPFADIYQRLSDCFQTTLRNGDGLRAMIERGERFVTVAAALYEHDASFRFLFNRWYRTQMRGPDWQVQRGAVTGAGLEGWSIDRARRTLALHEEPLFYASSLGPVRLEPDRRLVGALVDLVAPEEWAGGPAVEPHLNRGLHVCLENQALHALRDARRQSSAPTRVSAQWSRDAASLWGSVNKAHRVAMAEDAWLAAHPV
ncbi:MAG: PipA/GogA/GtgA family type III secretion system effector [Janthinobacterium lividum]